MCKCFYCSCLDDDLLMSDCGTAGQGSMSKKPSKVCFGRAGQSKAVLVLCFGLHAVSVRYSRLLLLGCSRSSLMSISCGCQRTKTRILPLPYCHGGLDLETPLEKMRNNRTDWRENPKRSLAKAGLTGNSILQPSCKPIRVDWDLSGGHLRLPHPTPPAVTSNVGGEKRSYSSCIWKVARNVASLAG